MGPDLWITSLLFDLNYEFFNGSFAFSPGLIYILSEPRIRECMKYVHYMYFAACLIRVVSSEQLSRINSCFFLWWW